MKRLVLILLFFICLNLRAQTISNDTKHVYAGIITTMGSTTAYYNLTKKKGLSIGLGWLTGIGVGAFKEYVWDGRMKRGVKNNNDFILTGWGATVGVPVWIISNDIKEKKIEKEKYEFLNRPQLN